MNKGVKLSLLQQIILFIINILFFIWYGVYSFVTAFFCLPVNFIYYRAWRKENRPLAARRFNQFYGRMVIRLSWPLIRTNVENRECAVGIEPCVYVMNHYSFGDVYFCGVLPGYNIVIVLRSWPFKIPILNIFMRMAKYLDVEANPGEDILLRAENLLNSGACLLFFPEGHRSRTGKLLPFGKGPFLIAAKNNVPVIPIVIEGTEYLAGYKSKLLSPTKVRMRFFPAMRANGSNYADINDLRKRVEDLYLREVYNQNN